MVIKIPQSWKQRAENSEMRNLLSFAILIFVLGTHSVGQLGEMNGRNQGFHRQEEQNTATQATFHNQLLEFLPEADTSILWSVARFHPQKENPAPGGLFQSSSSCCLWNPGLFRKISRGKGSFYLICKAPDSDRTVTARRGLGKRKE